MALTEEQHNRTMTLVESLKAVMRNGGNADAGAVIAARKYLPEWGAGKAWAAGALCAYTGQPWRCVQGHTAQAGWQPGEGGAALWAPYHGMTPETALPWVAPTGAHDMYRAGEYMTIGGQTWACAQDTAYSPAQYPAAWEAVEDA
ncbi:hypothetical protein FACS1894196_4820 [Clostridia bacterium]|nr:hypothetical protein FACS1894196_4820 [Clostridia bacterium]